MKTSTKTSKMSINMKTSNFKTKMASIALMGLLSITGVSAKNTDTNLGNVFIQRNAVKEQITSHIKFPKHLKSEIGEEAKVKVSFVCNEKGEVVDIQTESTLMSLKNYVDEEMRKLKIKTGEKGMNYSIDLIFKLL
jgi:hypothetical protein